MLSIAFKNLFERKIRLALSAFAIALAVVLIMVIDGFAVGIYDQVTVFYRKAGADLLVFQSGVEGMRTSMSSLPGPLRNRLGDVKGVKEVHDFIYIPTILQPGGDKVPVLLFGYHPAGNIGGPWKLGEGRAVRKDDEVVLDFAFAKQYGFNVGDKIDIMGRSFRVVGLSLETASWMAPYVFISKDAAASLLRAGDSVSIFLIRLNQGASPAKVRDDIDNQFPGVDAFTPSRMATKERDAFAGVMGNVLSLVTAIAFSVGVLVVGLVVYTAVIERISEYGILKSIGAGNSWLYGMVITQSVVSTVLGFALGVVLSVYIGRGIEALVPKFEVAIGTASVLRGGIAVFVMAIIASYMPMRRIAAIDPSLVFKG